MRTRVWFVISILMVFVLACGLGGSSKDKAAEPSEGGKPAGKVTAVMDEVEDVEEEEWEEVYEDESAPDSSAPLYFRDDFDGEYNEDYWFQEVVYSTGEDYDEEDERARPQYSIKQRRGALRFEINSPWVYLYHFYEPHTYKDVRIDFEVENKGVNANNIGMVLRYTDYGWYEIITTSGGYYSIMRFYEDGSKELKKGGIKSIRFGREKKNRYTAMIKGKFITFLVNDVEIAYEKDEEIVDPGYVGINISAERALPVEVEVNWLEISQP